MAAAIKALNARIRANPTLDYFCSTHFWGPASNFGIPIAAIADTRKEPTMISGRTTCALMSLSAVLMRFSMAVTPKNYLLFAMHFVNFGAQGTQLYRFTNYWYLSGQGAAKVSADEGRVAPTTQSVAEKAVSSASSSTKVVKGNIEDQSR